MFFVEIIRSLVLMLTKEQSLFHAFITLINLGVVFMDRIVHWFDKNIELVFLLFSGFTDNVVCRNKQTKNKNAKR